MFGEPQPSQGLNQNSFIAGESLMPPIVKENEVPGTTPENSAARTSTKNGQPDETANRPQPVALEVPVTVNGARTIEGSDKREPFSEATKTVLIFGSGAVIRLSSPVAPGQLLFLTNEKTKKEVVCQVVKSKNYRSVSGYVELEFTEPVVGFWGMRFPGDRAVTPPSPAAAGSPGAVPPAPPKAISPVVSAAPKATEVKSTPVPLAPKPVETKSGELFGSTPAVRTVPPAPKMPTAIAPAGIEVPSAPQAKPAVPTAVKQEPLPTTGQGSTEALKLQAAQLQEQLSSMLFTGNQAAPQTSNAQTATSPGKTSGSEAASKVLEMAKAESNAAKPMPPAKVSPPPIKSSLDTEEVKIPAWLEPLARNTAAPASTQELLEREKAKLTTKPVEPQEPKAGSEAKTETESVTALPEMVPSRETEGAELGLYSFEKEFNNEESASGGTKKGLWIGLAAAGMIAVAAGGWYFYKQKLIQQTSAAGTTPTPNIQPTQSVAQSVIPTTASPAQNATTNAASSNKPDANAMVSNAQLPAATAPGNPASGEKVNPKAGQNARETTRDTVKESARTVPAAENEVVLRTVEPAQKKPGFGKVRLATPKVSRAAANQENGVSEPTLSSSETGANADALGSGLAITNAKQPAAPEAPVPVGGDVRAAKLASSVSPIYPALARSQHVSGDVKIDALIDANGRVTSMKVIAGPTLLHQSAMDALRQWKYQPATLDGKPVPMHLTVTLQFRLQ